MAIVNGKFPLAILEYKKAFSLNGIHPFAKDYYNASLCAVQLNSKKQTFIWIDRLLKEALNHKVIESDTSFTLITKSKSWKKYLKLKPNVYPKELLDTLQSLHSNDQHFRKMPGSYKIYGDTIRKIDVENDRILRSIIGQYGYPSEKLLGLSDGINFEHNFEIVIWHQTTANQISDYTNILINAAQNGLIVPQRAAALIENQSGNIPYGMDAFLSIECLTCGDSLKNKLYKKLFYYEISKERTAKFDLERAKIGLEPLDDYNRKVLFSLKNKKYKFYGIKGVPNYIFKEDKDVNSFIENLKSINE